MDGVQLQEINEKKRGGRRDEETKGLRDGETERLRDGETERRRDEETERRRDEGTCSARPPLLSYYFIMMESGNSGFRT
jgi:hypothetical protein